MHTKASLLALVALASTTVTASPDFYVPSGIQHRHHHVARHVGHGHGSRALRSLKRQDASSRKKDRCAARQKAADDAQKKAEEEAAKKAEEEREKAEAEKKAAEEAERRKAAEEAERRKKEQEEEDRRKAEEDKKKQEQENDKKNDDGGKKDDANNGGGNRGGHRAFNHQTGDGTFYKIGLNACGTVDSGDDMIAAVSQEMFDTFPGAGPNPNKNPICQRKVRATYKGKSVVVRITDRCAGCWIYGALDFSPHAFEQLADFSVGRLHGVEWDFID